MSGVPRLLLGSKESVNGRREGGGSQAQGPPVGRGLFCTCAQEKGADEGARQEKLLLLGHT